MQEDVIEGVSRGLNMSGFLLFPYEEISENVCNMGPVGTVSQDVVGTFHAVFFFFLELFMQVFFLFVFLF